MKSGTFLIGALIAASTQASAATGAATKMSIAVGTSDSNVKNLAVADGKVLKLYTSNRGALDVQFQSASVSASGSMSVEAVFKQNTAKDQFTLQAKTASGSFVNLGVLTQAKKLSSFKFALPAGAVINNVVTLRMTSSKSADDCQLDALLIAGGGSTPTPNPAPTPAPTPNPNPGQVSQIPAGTSWYWQLSGAVNANQSAAKVYDIDLEDNSAALFSSLKNAGHTVICYFSAGTYEDWRSDASKFPAAALGSKVDGWEGENWLDVRNATVRQIMKDRLDIAKAKGCHGVEPDNVDGYDNKNGLGLTKADQIDFLSFLADEAHKRGMTIALKNSSGLVSALVNKFDFAVVEECFKYNECEEYSPFVEQNKAVLNAEYTAYSSATCSQAKRLGFSTVFFNLDLNGKKYEPCQ